MIENIEKYKFLLTSVGRDAVVSEIRRFRESFGENWLNEFKADFPELAEIVNLAANKSSEETFSFLKIMVVDFANKQPNVITRTAIKTAGLGFLATNQNEVLQLHAELQNEINRKR